MAKECLKVRWDCEDCYLQFIPSIVAKNHVQDRDHTVVRVR